MRFSHCKCVFLYKKKVKILDSRSIIPEFSNNSSVLEKFLGRYSKMALVKVYMPRLFIDSSLTGTNQYDYLLCLDSDTLILDDISRILDNGLVCGCMGNIAIDKLTNKKLFTCLDGSDVKPNGGVILYKRQFIDILTNEGIDYFSIVDETLTELISTNQQFIDEFTICISLKKTKQDKCYLTVIGNEYNCDPRYFYYNNPKIVHSVGGGSKFWNNPLMNRFFPNWEKNNRYWLFLLSESGLSQNEIQCKNHSIFKSNLISELIKERENRRIWETILRKIQFSYSGIWQSPSLTSKFVQFHINKIHNQKIHFELVHAGYNQVFIEFHIEDPRVIKLIQTNNTIDLKSISTEHCYSYIDEKNKIEFKISSNTDALRHDFHAFIKSIEQNVINKLGL